MSKTAGIVDIGSNTVVLVIASFENGTIQILQNISTSAGLIDFLHDSHLDRTGIDKVCTILRSYRTILEHTGIDSCRGFITEPGRGIDNLQEALSAFTQEGFDIQPLSGRQEAEYDYYGSRLDCGSFTHGLIMDIGGGSSELIRYHNSRILEAVSIPLGCVRLLRRTDSASAALESIHSTLRSYPLLVSSETVLIGIGGTMRALAAVSDRLYHTGNSISIPAIQDMILRLKNRDLEIEETLNAVVKPERRDLILPGSEMLTALCSCLPVQTLNVSAYGVREGYLIQNIFHETPAAH